MIFGFLQGRSGHLRQPSEQYLVYLWQLSSNTLSNLRKFWKTSDHLQNTSDGFGYSLGGLKSSSVSSDVFVGFLASQHVK